MHSLAPEALPVALSSLGRFETPSRELPTCQEALRVARHRGASPKRFKPAASAVSRSCSTRPSFSLYVQDHRCCGLPTLAKPCSLQRARPGAGGPRGKILRHRRVPKIRNSGNVELPIHGVTDPVAPVENGAWHRTARPDEDRRRGTQTADAAASRSRS